MLLYAIIPYLIQSQSNDPSLAQDEWHGLQLSLYAFLILVALLLAGKVTVWTVLSSVLLPEVCIMYYVLTKYVLPDNQKSSGSIEKEGQ